MRESNERPTCERDRDGSCGNDATHDIVCHNEEMDPMATCVEHIAYNLQTTYAEANDRFVRLSVLAR